MTELNQIYKCNICGNIAEMVHTGVGHPVCCDQPMKILEEKTKDEGMEKHVPVIEKNGNEVKVRVGEVAHPMEEDHYIEWIEVLNGERVYRKFLNPTDAPEAVFKIASDEVHARAYCNIHGLWSSKL